MQQPEVLSNREMKLNLVTEFLFPMDALSKESTIPIAADWVITMVEPVTKLNEMYMEDVVNNEQTNKR